MGSHSITCYPAEVTFPPLPQPKLVLDKYSISNKYTLNKLGVSHQTCSDARPRAARCIVFAVARATHNAAGRRTTKSQRNNANGRSRPTGGQFAYASTVVASRLTYNCRPI